VSFLMAEIQRSVTLFAINPCDRIMLLHGPYRTLTLRKSDRATCLFRDCAAVATSLTDVLLVLSVVLLFVSVVRNLIEQFTEVHHPSLGCSTTTFSRRAGWTGGFLTIQSGPRRRL
jgi:hypothetical protein